jgi:hypothetical protein
MKFNSSGKNEHQYPDRPQEKKMAYKLLSKLGGSGLNYE